ncbi:DUF4190 domain-containing protein [Microbacterium sp. P5_E9]
MSDPTPDGTPVAPTPPAEPAIAPAAPAYEAPVAPPAPPAGGYPTYPPAYGAPAAPAAEAYPGYPAPTYGAPAYGAPAYGTAPAPAYGAYAAPKTNVLAIVSLVAALVGMFIIPFIGSVVAVITGHMSLSQIKRTGENGRGMALAGTIVGYVGIGLSIIGFIILIAVFGWFAANTPGMYVRS